MIQPDLHEKLTVSLHEKFLRPMIQIFPQKSSQYPNGLQEEIQLHKIKNVEAQKQRHAAAKLDSTTSVHFSFLVGFC